MLSSESRLRISANPESSSLQSGVGHSFSMNTKLFAEPLKNIKQLKVAISKAKKVASWLAAHRGLLSQLGEDVTLNSSGSSLWFTVHTREDLSLLLTLAPQWTKETGLMDSASIDYTASLKDGDFYGIRIHAFEGALPPTCKLVEVEVEEPARPARLVKKMVVQCPKPTLVEQAEAVVTLIEGRVELTAEEIRPLRREDVE